jgi:histone H3/H4
MSLGQHIIHFKGVDPNLALDVTFMVKIRDIENLNEVTLQTLEMMKELAPKICDQFFVKIEASVIDTLKDTVRATISSLGLERNLEKVRLVRDKVMLRSVEGLLRLAATRAKNDKRESITGVDITYALIDINASQSVGWPFANFTSSESW